MRLSGALQKKRNSELGYREVVKNSSNDETIAAKQVRPGSTGALLEASSGQVLCGPAGGQGGPGQAAVCGSSGESSPRSVPGASLLPPGSSVSSRESWQKGHQTQVPTGSPAGFKYRFPGLISETYSVVLA